MGPEAREENKAHTNSKCSQAMWVNSFEKTQTFAYFHGTFSR